MGKELSDNMEGVKIPSTQRVEDSMRKYYDKHIAYESMGSRKIVAFGDDPAQVMEEARKICMRPVLSYYFSPDSSELFQKVA